jgi:transposase
MDCDLAAPPQGCTHRPFVQTNKTDAADARAIWTAGQQPGMRTVAAKTEDQQTMLSLHRIRSLLVKFRTMQVNQLRGLLYEFGACFRAGRVGGLAEVRARMVELEEALPGAMMCSLQDQLRRIDGLQTEIDQLEHRIAARQRQDAACSAIAAVPGIGKLTATALVATMGDAATFRSGREFAAFLGLVPRQSGTGGKVRLGSISKRGGSVPAHVAHPRRAIGAVPREDARTASSRCRDAVVETASPLLEARRQLCLV